MAGNKIEALSDFSATFASLTPVEMTGFQQNNPTTEPVSLGVDADCRGIPFEIQHLSATGIRNPACARI